MKFKLLLWLLARREEWLMKIVFQGKLAEECFYIFVKDVAVLKNTILKDTMRQTTFRSS
jgi:hypothetical protein